MTSLDSYVDDVNVFVRFLGLGADFGVGDPLDHLHAFGAPSEHRVLVVEPGLQDKERAERRTCVNLLLAAIQRNHVSD